MSTKGSLDIVSRTYEQLQDNVSKYQNTIGRPLTASEKILTGHIHDLNSAREIRSGSDYIFLDPDRVALQDVTGQMTLLQFMQSGLSRVVVPTTVHCDLLIRY
jgi:aconitate hydratase